MYLTLEDPRARVKGSRDPLGVQPLWTRFGRHLVGNLTTVTNSVRNFSVLLIGRRLAGLAVEERRASEDDALSIFLRWEQVAGYVRHLVHGVEGDVRGIERVKRRILEAQGTVEIGVGPDETILSDQRTYGLWGLFTVAARISGLLPDGVLDVADSTREFLETEYLPRLGRMLDPLLELVVDGGSLSTDPKDRLVQAVGRVLEPDLTAAERDFYRLWLRDCSGTAPREGVGTQPSPGSQRRLADLMAAELPLDAWLDRTSVTAIAKAAGQEGLGDRLRRALTLEAAIAPLESAFEFLLARRNAPVTSVASRLSDAWGADVPCPSEPELAALQPEIADVVGDELCSAVLRSVACLQRAEYQALVHELVAWNELVMRGRGGGPWVAVQADRLDVRYGGPEMVLPSREEVGHLWRNTYFLDSLREVTRQLLVEGA